MLETHRTFAFPQLSPIDLGLFRIFGPGLGNLLFPWARATMFAHSNHCALLAPTWLELTGQAGARTWLTQTFGLRWRFKGVYGYRIRPGLRNYGHLFTCPPKYISGLQKMRLLAFEHRTAEHHLTQPLSPGVVVFTGLGNQFDDLQGAHSLLFSELLQIVRPEHFAGLNFDFSRSFTAHIRLGDKPPPRPDELYSSRQAAGAPLEWYVQTLRSLRTALGQDIKLYVISDGFDDELRLILSEPHVQRLSFGSAIADLLALSASCVLLCSPSTFSGWGAFLGRAPAIWFKGRRPWTLYADAPSSELDRDLDEQIPSTFLQRAHIALESYRPRKPSD